MSDPDPLHGTDLPPVPPTALPVVPIGDPPRHSLVDSAGDPIPPSGVTDHVVDVNERLSQVNWRVQRAQRDIVILGVGLVVILAVVLTLGYLLYAQQSSDAASARSERLAADVERARVDGILRTADCTELGAWRATYSKAARDADPLGSGSYDTLFSQLAKAATTLNCDAG